MTTRPRSAAALVDTDELRRIGLEAGLDRVGFATADPLDETRVVIERRKAQGLHGGMQFTYRNPGRSTEPGRTVPHAATLIVAAKAYPATDAAAPDGAGPHARVARYATSDHYAELRRGLGAIVERLHADGWRARVVVDDNALVDRAAAQRAGIGWYGKNANVLVDGFGSSVVLGSIITDAALVTDRPVDDGCGSCARCLDACPTGALVEPGVLDARRCLAWLVQAEGVFPADHRVALGDRIYGCDDCQDACPPTIRFGRRGSVPAATVASTWISLLDLLQSSDAELMERHGRWYIPRRDPRYLRRNALVVLANTAPVPIDAAVARVLEAALAHPDALVRAHAVWAARRLGAPSLVASCADDAEPVVLAELARDVPARAGSPSAGTVPSPPGAFR